MVVEAGGGWCGGGDRRSLDVGRRPESSDLRVVDQVAEVEVGKVEFDSAFGVMMKGDVFTGEDLADIVVMAVVPEMSG